MTFDSNGGSEVTSQTIYSGETAIEPAIPTNGDLYFGGWKLNGVDYDFSTPVNSNITLVASWLSSLPYLTFYSDTEFCLSTTNNKKHWDGTLEYSTDKVNWATWNGTSTLSSKTIYLRGTNNTYICGTGKKSWSANTYSYITDIYGFSFGTARVYCSGNIENLLDYNTVYAGNHPTMGTNCYRELFKGTMLLSAPELPATTLADYC